MAKIVQVRKDYATVSPTEYDANAIHVDSHGSLIIEKTGTGLVAIYAAGKWTTAAVVEANPTDDEVGF